MKQRLDKWLVQQHPHLSRSRAVQLIKQGDVTIDGNAALNPSCNVLDGQHVQLTESMQWVSRGSLKLVHALEQFSLSVEHKTCLDIGASTGGFTEILLHARAKKVYAVDVGQGQLHPSLQAHPYVKSLEGVNARYLEAAQLANEAPDIIVCDASFISLRLVLPASLKLAAKGAQLVALIKPQFEVGKEKVGKNGVVKDAALHEACCQEIRDWLETLPHWQVKNIIDSPITGPKGNKEFLLWASHKV